MAFPRGLAADSEATAGLVGLLSRTDRPKILYIIHQRDYSGAEMMQVPLLRADADPLVACPPESRTEQWLHAMDIPTVPLPFSQLRHSGGVVETFKSVVRGLRTAWELRRVLRRHPERTTLCCTSVRPGLLAALAQSGLSRKSLWVVTDFLPRGPLGHLIRAIATYGCSAAVPSSDILGRDFVGGSRRLSARTTTVYPGVDVDHYSPGPRGRTNVACVIGHVSPTKRTHLAVETAGLVAVQRPDFRLRIVGRAQYRDEDFVYERRLRSEVERDARLRKVVSYEGYSDDVRAQLAGCGLLLHMRPDEPFGIVLIEAMALGLPVVAPRSGGPAEIVEHGVTGFLFAPGDVRAAADHVISLLDDETRAVQMGAAGRERACRLFSTSVQLKGFEAVFSSLDPPASAHAAG